MARGTRKSRSSSAETRPPVLAEERHPAGEAPRDSAPLTAPAFLAKFAELSLMASFTGAVIAYHLSLPEGWLVRMAEWMMRLNDGNPVVWKKGTSALSLLILDFSPALGQGLPILELKTSVWLMGALILFGVHLLARLYEAFFKSPVFVPVAEGAMPRRRWARWIPLGSLLAFAVYSLLSFSGLGWAPPVPGDALAIAPDAGDGEVSGVLGLLARVGGKLAPTGAGTYHSWVAWVQVVGGLLFFLVAEDLLRTRRLVYKVLGLMLGLGVIAAAVAVLANAKLPGLSTIWVKWGPENNRNDVAGFIGHNTALSSFLMAPMLLIWTQLLAHGRILPKWAKALAYGAMTAMAVALVMAQSRAVVPILGAAFVVLTFLLSRRAGLRPPAGMLVAIPLVLAGVVLSQFIRHPANPLYRSNLPLAVRLQHMKPEHLKSETRLRMIVCSLPRIREHPFVGAGFGSFQYVFPEAQGEYYAAHPDSWLAPTRLRSFHAHNEYLQTLFETGGVGLVMALAGLGAILVSGWRALGRSFRQRHIALQLAVLVALAAMLAHAFVDFPLRVAPLCSMLVLLLAIWSAGDRLWPIAVPPMEAREPQHPPLAMQDGIFSSGEVVPPAAAPGPGGLRAAAARVSWIVLAAALAFLAVLLAASASTWFAARTLNLRAQSTMDSYLDEEAATGRGEIARIWSAHQSLNDARRLTPLFGEPYFYGARLLYMQAGAMDRDRIEAQRAGNELRANELRRQILETARNSQILLARSLAEFRYHGSYQQRALNEYLLFRLGGESESDAHLSAAIESLELGVLMNPGDPEMIRTLIDWKERYRPRQTQQILNLHALLRHFHREFYDDRVMREGLALRSLADYRGALERLRVCVEIAPGEPEYREYYATTATLAGELALAHEQARALAGLDSPIAPAVEALVEAREHQYDLALRTLEHPLLGREERPRLYRALLRSMIAATLAESRGSGADAQKEYAALRELASRHPDTLLEIALHLLSVFDNPPRAAEFARARLAIAEPPPRANAYAVLAEATLAPHRGLLAKVAEKQRLAAADGQPLPYADDPAAAAAIGEAIELLDSGLLVPGSRLDVPVLRRRAQELRAMLPPSAPAK